MPEPFVSSDPTALLWGYWAELHRQPFFGHLAPELQAGALAAAIERDHPAKAAEIREWNPVTLRAMLSGLDQALKERHAAKVVELWRLRKGEREVRCVAVYLVTGIDLRLLEGHEMLRTELFEWAHVLQAKSRSWRNALVNVGWKEAA